MNSTTFGPTGEDVCKEEDLPITFIGISLPILIILILSNGLLLLAITLNWSKLRHSIVYVYLISCLLSVISFCFVSAYEMLHVAYHFDDVSVDGGVLQRYNQLDQIHTNVMRSWSFRRAFTVALLVVMELNVATLIYAVGYNACFVSRTSAAKEEEPRNRVLRYLKNSFGKNMGKRKKAFLQLSAAWLTPIVICIPTAVNWNCIEYCTCLPAYRSHSEECSVPKSVAELCSRVWIPTSQSFVIVFTVFYMITVVVMLTCLAAGIRRFFDTVYKSTGNDHTEEALSSVNAGNLATVSTAVDGTTTVDGTVAEDRKSPLMKRPKLPDTIKLLIALSVSVTVSVSPMILMWFYDIFDKSDSPLSYEFDLAIAITFLHALSLPIIMLLYMAGLRKACKDAILRCSCLTTTIAIKKKKTTRIQKRQFQAKDEKRQSTETEIA